MIADVSFHQGKVSEKKHVANLDLFKLSSLHAKFKRKIRMTIVELQEEQEQIEQQSGKFYQVIHLPAIAADDT